jgi:hypothetical protein
MIYTLMLDPNTVSYIIRGRSQAARAKNAAQQDDEIYCILGAAMARSISGCATFTLSAWGSK